MDLDTLMLVGKLALELTLGLSIKLLCDNGRIHWRDLVNDSIGTLPGMTALAGDGLTRQVSASVPMPVEEDEVTHALAAK